MIVKNRLLNFKDTIIYQDDDYFEFSLDSVLLANFVTIKLADKRIIDLCTGNAPIPMLLSFRTKARIFGVELQKNIYDLGVKSVIENGLNNKIELINCNVLDLNTSDYYEKFDVVTCNPPYFKYEKGNIINPNMGKALARHEIKITLDEIIKIAKHLLKNGGTFSMVHRADRLIEIINIMQKYKIEPKKIRVVYSKIDKPSNTILIEGVKNGKSGLKILNPLIVYDNNNKYCKEVVNMFGDGNNVAEKL